MIPDDGLGGGGALTLGGVVLAGAGLRDVGGCGRGAGGDRCGHGEQQGTGHGRASEDPCRRHTTETR